LLENFHESFTLVFERVFTRGRSGVRQHSPPFRFALLQSLLGCRDDCMHSVFGSETIGIVLTVSAVTNAIRANDNRSGGHPFERRQIKTFGLPGQEDSHFRVRDLIKKIAARDPFG
jgi:hypothetical protein